MPASQIVALDSPVTFSVTAVGTPPLAYQWFKNGVAIAGFTGASLSLASAKRADAGSYTVRVTNAAGSVTSDPAFLVVQAPATVPVIITPPSAATSSVGAPASFSVVADGAPPLSYVWRREGTLIAKASQSTLVLGSVQVADAGDYTVTVSNALGSVTSSPARLTVLVPSLPPFIVVQPVSVTATAGGAASFGVTVRGTAPLSYQWRKDGERLVGATQATLTLTNVRATDAAAYSVAITNAFGTAVSASARLTVNPAPTPPQIETSPTDRTVTEGATVSLSVTASGVGPLSYRWLKGGVAIVGATSATLTFSPVRLTDAGSYAVEVSNAAGTAVSTAAVVRVEPRPSSRITNVSIRTPLAVGQTLIVGLSMSGGAKAVLVRAVGPGLSPFGVSDAMADPRLMLFRGAVVEGMSHDWGGGPTLAATFASVGAFALPAGSRDAALVATIDGGRTVQVVGASPGTVLVEAYDAGAGDSPRLVNVSARNRVNGSSEPLIAGFTVVGNAPRTILIRGVGPTLASFGVLGALSDPRLELYSGATKINENDTWATSLSTTFGAVGAFALIPGGRDAALLVTLAPGGYTVQVSGVGGATGDALIELYEVISP